MKNKKPFSMKVNLLIILFFGLGYTLNTFAIEVAPRISDREIIEALVDLKAAINAQDQQFKAMDQKFDQQFKTMDQKFDQQFKAMDQKIEQQFKTVDQQFKTVDQQFKAMDQKIEQQFKTVDQQFKAVDQQFKAVDQQIKTQFEAVNRRMDDMREQISSIINTMLTLFSIIVSLIVALFGYIAWDRYTMVKPLRERIEHLEFEFNIVKSLREQIERIEQELCKNLETQHPEGSLLTRMLKAFRERAQFDHELNTALRANSLL